MNNSRQLSNESTSPTPKPAEHDPSPTQPSTTPPNQLPSTPQEPPQPKPHGAKTVTSSLSSSEHNKHSKKDSIEDSIKNSLEDSRISDKYIPSTPCEAENQLSSSENKHAINSIYTRVLSNLTENDTVANIKSLSLNLYMTTLSNGKIYIKNPDRYIYQTNADLLIDEIAHGLSQTNRFGSQAKFPYSVAMHSVEVSSYARISYPSLTPQAILYAALHDAGEAYGGLDIPTPWSLLGIGIKTRQKMIVAALMQKFKCDITRDEIETVKLCDNAIAGKEASLLFDSPDILELFPNPVITSEELLHPIQEYHWRLSKIIFKNHIKDIFEMMI